MKPYFFPLFLIIILTPLTLEAKEVKLGEPLILNTVTKVSEINSNPQDYLGKRVRIEGLVTEVCARRGCWLDIASDVPFEKIQVKVVDGVIIFPLESKGRNAQVEGIVEELNLTEDQALYMAKHRAEEQGTKFDPASVSGPQRIYRLQGLGAVIEQ